MVKIQLQIKKEENNALILTFTLFFVSSLYTTKAIFYGHVVFCACSLICNYTLVFAFHTCTYFKKKT